MERTHPIEQVIDKLHEGFDKARMIGVFVVERFQEGGWSNLPRPEEENITHYGEGEEQ